MSRWLNKFSQSKFLIACITPIILFIWDLIRSVNISGHVAPPSVCCLSLWNCPTRVSPPALQNIGFSLCAHFVLPRKVVQEQKIDTTLLHAFQKNRVSACCNILLWFMSDLFCNWTGCPATSCLTIWFMNQFMPKEYELGIQGERSFLIYVRAYFQRKKRI